jgi:hypothetical protein
LHEPALLLGQSFDLFIEKGQFVFCGCQCLANAALILNRRNWNPAAEEIFDIEVQEAIIANAGIDQARELMV